MEQKKDNNLSLDKLGSIAFTIFIGALGSGTWEYFLKPFYETNRFVIISILALGKTTLEDSIYSGITVFYFKSFNNTIFIISVPILISLMVFGFLTFIEKENTVDDFVQQTRNQLEAFKEGLKIASTKENTEKIDDVFQKIENVINESLKSFENSDFYNKLLLKQSMDNLKIKTASLIVIISSITVLFFVLAFWVTNEYQYSLANYMKLKITMCTPYISDLDEKHLRSQFVSISSKSDYLFFEKRLDNISNKNGIKFPEFRF